MPRTVFVIEERGVICATMERARAWCDAEASTHEYIVGGETYPLSNHFKKVVLKGTSNTFVYRVQEVEVLE